MLRRITLTAITVVAVGMVCGCANKPQPVSTDSVDAIIAANAVQATKALRELSETTGNSRVVTSADSGPKSATNPKINLVPMHETREVAQSPAIKHATKSIAESASAVAVELPTPPTPQVKLTSPAITAQPNVTAPAGGLLSGAPAGLDKKISIHWVGELEQLLGKIAAETGWKMADSVGLVIAPVVISVKADNRPAYEVLRDIGAITGTAAEIKISTASKTISVRYPIR